MYGDRIEEQRAWKEETLEVLDKRIRAFKRMFVDTIDEPRDSGLYTHMYHLLDHMLKELQKFGTLSFLNGSP